MQMAASPNKPQLLSKNRVLVVWTFTEARQDDVVLVFWSWKQPTSPHNVWCAIGTDRDKTKANDQQSNLGSVDLLRS